MRLITRQGGISEEHQPKCVLSSIYLQASCGLISHQLAGPLEMVKVTSIEMGKCMQLPQKSITKHYTQRLNVFLNPPPSPPLFLHTRKVASESKGTGQGNKPMYKAHHVLVPGLPKFTPCNETGDPPKR